MIDLKKFQDLKQRSERAKQERDKAEGALEQSMKRLKEEFDCDSLEEAQELLDRLKKNEADAEEQFNEKLEAFEEKWSDKI